MQFTDLPSDLLHGYIIPRYFLGHIREERDIDRASFPVMLLVLQLVSRRFNNAVQKCMLAWKAVQNFRACSKVRSALVHDAMLKRACREHGSITLMEWLKQYLHFPLSEKCYLGALRGGHTRLLKWLEDHKVPFDIYVPRCFPTLEVFQWFKQTSRYRNPEEHLLDLLRSAVNFGDLKMMEALYAMPECPAKKLQIDSFVLSKHTSLKALQLAVSNGAEIDQSITELACAGTTSAEVVRWLHEVHGCKFSFALCVNAIRAGKLDVLEYILAHHKHIFDTHQILSESLCSNRMEVVRWCFSKGVKINAEFCIAFYKETPNLLSELSAEMLEWFSIGSKEALREALQSASFLLHIFFPIHCWKFLTSIGIEPARDSVRQVAHSTSYLALDTLRFLLEELKCTFPTKPKPSPSLMRKDVITYLRKRGLLQEKS